MKQPKRTFPTSFSTSYIELSETALSNNIEFIKKLLRENCRLSSVVKGNAYGHGIELFVPLAEKCGVDHFSVFSAGEALKTYESIQMDSDIMIMGMVEGEELGWAIEHGIEFFVFDLSRLERAVKLARRINKRAKVHIEVETGMNRTGFGPEDIPEVMRTLRQNPEHLEFSGLCSHLAGAESIANYYRVQHQRSRFRKLKRLFYKTLFPPRYHHLACSAAMLRYPRTQMDMVRVGIMQYGFFPSPEILIHYANENPDDLNPLRRVLNWKSKVMSIKRVEKGAFISYGTSFQANEDMVIAAVPVGYAQGFSRSMSNKGRVLINGKRANVVGIVNMNMMLVDVTHIQGVHPDIEVVLIGKQGDNEISVASFGEISEQVNYELLTRLPERIPRRIVE